MPSQLCITVRFLQPYAHGRGDGDEPEWPPSPLRVFQALVAASAARWNERTRLEYAVPALEWLAKQCPKTGPTIVSVIGVPSDVKYRLYVPDNVADKVAKSWRGGNASASIADYRTEKDVRPTHLTAKNDEFAAVHYLYPVADAAEFAKHKQTLIDAARSITHLGWGVDMVAGDASEMPEAKVAELAGERWRPTKDGSGTPLRVPRSETLKALMEKHQAFLNRLQGDGFKPVPPLTTFQTVGYRRDTESASRPWVAFRILSADPDAPNPSFDTARLCCEVAGWVRHATAETCSQWPDVASFVHGHGDDGGQLTGEKADQRFMYLPLPSIERRGDQGTHVGAIRRVLFVVPPGCETRIEWARRRLAGCELVREDKTTKDKRTMGLLGDLRTDWVLDQYTGASRVWSTVTPVILPGYDDPDHIRRQLRANRESQAPSATTQKELLDQLETRGRDTLVRAFRQAGFAEEFLAQSQFQWRNVGFRPGTDLATRYALAHHHRRFSVYHVRVVFPNPVSGPLAVGAGRYRGLGLFVAESN